MRQGATTLCVGLVFGRFGSGRSVQSRTRQVLQLSDVARAGPAVAT
jgi:hypothetical protein